MLVSRITGQFLAQALCNDVSHVPPLSGPAFSYSVGKWKWDELLNLFCKKTLSAGTTPDVDAH